MIGTDETRSLNSIIKNNLQYKKPLFRTHKSHQQQSDYNLSDHEESEKNTLKNSKIFLYMVIHEMKHPT